MQLVDVAVTKVVRRTEKALLIDQEGVEGWVPRSLVETLEVGGEVLR